MTLVFAIAAIAFGIVIALQNFGMVHVLPVI